MSMHLRGVKPSLSPDREALTKAPPVPRYFSNEAKAEWKRIIPRLIEDQIITKSDLAGVENYCIAAGRVREIEALFNAGGLDKTLFGMQNRAMQTARQLAAEYGLTPTSRARVGGGSSDANETPNPLMIGRGRR